MEDCMLDFDIDLLQPLSKSDSSILARNIRNVKKRLISTTRLLKRYQFKQLRCKNLEDVLQSTTRDVQNCTAGINELEKKCAALEQEVVNLTGAKRQIEEKYIEADNQYLGIKSHSKQLELLLKEKETAIEGLRIEYQLEKSSSKDLEKKYGAIQKENEYLIKNIHNVRDIVFGKKTATKEIKAFFDKYKKSDVGNESQDENSADESDAFDDCLSPFLDPGMYNNILGSSAGNKNKIAEKLQSTSINGETRDDNDHDSESSNGIVSLDTGRGSSLAFTDSEKGSPQVLSPEYFINSPLSAGGVCNKAINVVSVATSPIRTREFTCAATSPIIYTSSLSEQSDTEESDQFLNTSNKRKSNAVAPVVMVDRVVSPILTIQHADVSTITDKNTNCDVATSPLKLDNRPTDGNYVSDHNIQENDWLITDDSNNVGDENSNDGEIQMIFDSMRFHENLLTPIPSTPAKPRSDAASIATTHAPSDVNICRDSTLQGNVVTLREDVDRILDIMNTDPMKIKMMVDYIKELNEAMTLYNRQLQTKTNLVENKDAFVAMNPSMNRQLQPTFVENKDTFVNDQDGGVTKKVQSFKSKMTKMKELFDDSSPPSPIDGISPLRPIKYLSDVQSPPSHAPQLLPPPFTSPVPSITLSPMSRSNESPLVLTVTPFTRSPATMAKSPMSLVPGSPTPISRTSGTPSGLSPALVSPPPRSPMSVAPVSPSYKSPASGHSTPRSASPVSRPPSRTPVSPSTALNCMSPKPVSPNLAPLSLSGQNLSSNKNMEGDISLNSKERLHFEESPPLSLTGQNLSSNKEMEGDISFNSKERLHFEDALPNDESLSDEASDQEIIYEHEIVVELAPDTQAGDKDILHKILQEQVDLRPNTKDVSPEIKNVTHTPKKKKITKLEKLRKNLVPKCKITNSRLRERKPKAKLRIQPKRLTANKQRVLGSECSIDPKAAYEKARKIMAELKANEKVPSNTGVTSRMSKVPENNDSKLIEGDQLLKHSTIATGNIHSFEQEIQKKQALTSPTSNTMSKSALEDTPRFKKPLTNSKNKRINNNEDNSEVIQFNTSHLKSPSLKSYGRNRVAHKPQTKCINNNDTLTPSFVQHDNVVQSAEGNDVATVQPENRKPLKRPLVDMSDVVSKRINISDPTISNNGTEEGNLNIQPSLPVEKIQNSIVKQQNDVHKDIISYDDLDLFDNGEVNTQKFNNSQQVTPNNNKQQIINTEQVTAYNNHKTDASKHEGSNRGILCTFLDKYGSKSLKRESKIPENVIVAICKQLEDSIEEIQKLPAKDTKRAMDALVKDLQTRSPRHMTAGLVNYLKDPARKTELFNKISVPPAPPMTKVEQILLYIVAQLNSCWPNYDIVDNMFDYMNYTLFALNRTPDFDAIETLSHFYAILCRYNKNRNRLRLFIIDAMYCLHFKAVPLIRQCLDVWMHILPLAHMGTAKTPLVMCLVYLLHFFKCDDKFNRVQDIRNILNRKYFYEMSEWNETAILEVFRNSILEVRDIPVEKKMLRMAFIILAKRNGARWCQKHIITNMLLPIIEDGNVPERIKLFCVSLLGPLLKPYPMDMKVNCEVVINQLFDMLKLNPSRQMEEAIYTSLIYMSRHNHVRVVKALLCWKPEQLSPDLVFLLKNFVNEKPLKSWKSFLSKIFIHE